MTTAIQLSSRMRICEELTTHIVAPALRAVDIPVYFLACSGVRLAAVGRLMVLNFLLPLSAGLLTCYTVCTLYRLGMLRRIVKRLPNELELANKTILPDLRSEISKLQRQLPFVLLTCLLVMTAVIVQCLAVVTMKIALPYLLFSAICVMCLQEVVEIMRTTRSQQCSSRDKQALVTRCARVLQGVVAIVVTAAVCATPLNVFATLGILLALRFLSLNVLQKKTKPNRKIHSLFSMPHAKPSAEAPTKPGMVFVAAPA